MTAVDRSAGRFAAPEVRVEGRAKVNGRLLYTADVQRPGMLWAAFVLRPLRFYGIATFLRQGWKTRAGGAEVALAPAGERAVI